MKRAFQIFVQVVTFAAAVLALMVALASFVKRLDPAVVRNGFAHDYTMLAVAAATFGTLLFIVGVVRTRRLLRSPSQPPASHF
jgi:NADH:ubiquinone oxidoreductase subunit 6 (subunit J)